MSTAPNSLAPQYPYNPALYGIDPTTGQPVNPALTQPGASDAGSSPYGNPYATTTPGLATSDTVNNSNFYNDQSIEYAQENQLQGEAQAQLGYYGPLQEQAQQNVQGALGTFQTTPGYTPAQSSQINVNYGQYNTPTSALSSEYLTPTEQSAMTGDTQTAVNANNAGESAEGAMLNQYQANLGGEVGNFDTGTSNAVSGLDTGLSGAQNFSTLNSAVSNPALSFNPGGNEQEITSAEMQQMETASGVTVGNQYQSAEDQLNRNAAAAGNTSPLALAAANARLQTQSAATAGDVENQSAIAALQAQESQATSIEQQRENAAQYQSGAQAQAGTTEEAAAQNAAALAGTQGVSAAEAEGTADINAANTYGQASVNEANTMTGQNYNALNTADTENTARAGTVATNRQATDTGINSTQYQQGTGSAQLTAGGATNVGQEQIAGRNTYLSGESQQQALNQQGGETAEGSQQTAASTLGTQLNTSEGNAGSFKNNSPTLAGQSSQLINSILDEGGVVTEPTIALVGEKRPEMIMPVGPRYKKKAA